MENIETSQPLPHDGSPAAVAVDILHNSVIKAFESVGTAMVAICRDQQIMATKINELIADRDAQVETVSAMMKKLGEITERIDADRVILQVLMDASTGKKIH